MSAIVQIFGVEHYEDALAVAALGADHLGFRIDDPAFTQGGQPCISAAEARRTFADLPPQTATVALFATPNESLVLSTVDACGPTIVQLCWHVDAMGPDREARLREKLVGTKVIKEIPVGGPETRERALESALRYQDAADLLILDSQIDSRWVGATGQPHDWSISREIVGLVQVPLHPRRWTRPGQCSGGFENGEAVGS